MVSDPDQTARANIRDCALALFAEHGFDVVTIREIAACADVSPALVLHHYGSKEGLREAVDAYVAGAFDAMLTQGAEAWDMANPEASVGLGEMMLRSLPAGTPIPSYLRRLLLSGDPVGGQLFRRWLGMTIALDERLIAAGMMRPTDDPEARAAFLMVNDLAMVLFRPHLVDAIGLDPLTPTGMKRWATNAIDAYANGVFTAEGQ
jgi:AcrR family transcriptional regulator